MIASVSITSVPNGKCVNIDLQNGQKIIGLLDECADHMSLVENTTRLEGDVAECAAAIAYVGLNDDGDDRVVWRKLVEKAERFRDKIERVRYNTN